MYDICKHVSDNLSDFHVKRYLESALYLTDIILILLDNNE